MSSLIVFFCVFLPFFLGFYVFGNKIRLEAIFFSIFVLISFIVYIIYTIILIIYMFLVTFRIRIWSNDVGKFYTLKLYYDEYVVFFEYWYYLVLYVNRFILSIFYSTIYYLYYIIFLRLLYSSGTVHIYYFIVEYSKFWFKEFYTNYNFREFTKVYFNIKSIWIYLWSGMFTSNKVPLVEVGYNDNVFKDNIFFKYGRWIKYPSFKGSLLFENFYINKVWYIIYSWVYVIEFMRCWFYTIIYRKNVNMYYKKTITILNSVLNGGLKSFVPFIYRKSLAIIYYCIYICQVIVLNIIYTIIFLSIKVVSLVIMFLVKYYKYFLCLLIMLIVLNNIWIFGFFFRSVYNHYTHNLPWALNGGNLRFLNFFSVDKRNFYFLIDFANRLSDYVGVIDKEFYVKMHNDFIKSLNNVFFTIDKGITPSMYNKDSYLNRDTILLYRLFDKYNKSMSMEQWRRFRNFRRNLKRFYLDSMDWSKKFPDFYKLLQYEFYARIDESHMLDHLDYSKVSNVLNHGFRNDDNVWNKRKWNNYLLNFDINSGPYLFRMSDNLFYNFLEDNEKRFKKEHNHLKEEDFGFVPKDTWALTRTNIGKSKRSVIIRDNYEKLYDSNMLKFFKNYKDLWKKEVIDIDDTNAYFASLVEDINGYLKLGSEFSNYFYKSLIEYVDKFYYNLKLTFNLNPVELKEFSSYKKKESNLRFSSLIDSPKINELVFHEARPQEEKGALIDDEMEEWAEPNVYRFIRRSFYKRKHIIRKYPYRMGNLVVDKGIVSKKLKNKIPLILNKFIQKKEFMNLSHEYTKFKRVALELNNPKKVELANLRIETLLHNFLSPDDMLKIFEDNYEEGLDESDMDYLDKKLFHFWSYRHYMQCRSLAIKIMKYMIYYDKVMLSDYGRWSEYFMDSNPSVQIEIITHRRSRGLMVHEETIERVEAYMERFEELFDKWKRCRASLEGKVKPYADLKKVINLKKKIYRKVYDLKKYAYVKSLKKSGNTIVRYLQSFSLDYHFNHLLWHSPFRAGLSWCRKRLEVDSLIDANDIFSFKYRIKNKKRKVTVRINHISLKVEGTITPKWKLVKVSNYSFMFNFMLNCFYLNEDNISAVLTSRRVPAKKYGCLYYEMLNCFYNYGHFRYNDLSFFDYFRVMCASLKDYYNSYIYNLYRWSYVLKEKDYGLYYFVNKKLMNLKKRWLSYKRWYLRLTLVKELYNKWRPWKKWRLVDTLRYDRYRFRFIPFFLIYSYYSKYFVDYLISKYFVQDRFLYWWLRKRLNISLMHKVYLKIFKVSYVFNTYYVKDFYRSLGLLEFLKKFDLVYWYFKIMFRLELSLTFYNNIKWNCVELLFRLYIVKMLYFVKLFKVDFNFDLKGGLLDNWVDSLTIKNIIKGLFNIRGLDLYIWESDDYFRRGKRMKRIRRKRVHAYPFWRAKSTIHQNYLVRRKKLFFLFSSIYMYSLRNLYFMYNDIYIKHFLSLVFFYEYFSNPMVSLKLYGLKSLKYYYLVYISFIILLYLYYKKFYNIFFPNWKEDEKAIDTAFVKRPNELWNEVRDKSVSYFFNKPFYYIEWLYKYYILCGKVYPFRELHKFKDSTIYKFVDQSKNVNFRYLLYYDPEIEYQELDKGAKNAIFDKVLKVTKKFINYLNLVNREMFNKKVYIFCEDYGIYKYMKKKLDKDEVLYEFFIDYGFGALFLCFFYWFLFIPGFFLSFIVRHLYYSSYGKMSGAFRVFCFLRSIIGDFTIVHNVCKFVEGPYFIHRWGFRKQSIDSTYMKMLWRRKRRKRSYRHFGKIASVYYNMLPLGGYYQWFHKLNYIRYSINFLSFYMKHSLLSNFYYKVMFLSLIIYICLFRYIYVSGIILFKDLNVKVSLDSYLYYIYSIFSYLNLKRYMVYSRVK